MSLLHDSWMGRTASMAYTERGILVILLYSWTSQIITCLDCCSEEGTIRHREMGFMLAPLKRVFMALNARKLYVCMRKMQSPRSRWIRKNRVSNALTTMTDEVPGMKLGCLSSDWVSVIVGVFGSWKKVAVGKRSDARNPLISYLTQSSHNLILNHIPYIHPDNSNISRRGVEEYHRHRFVQSG